MDSFTRLVRSLLQLLIQLANIIVTAVLTIELWLRAHLVYFGLPPVVQTVIMVALAALLILGSLRLFGGLIRTIMVLVLILIALHILLPVLPH